MRFSSKLLVLLMVLVLVGLVTPYAVAQTGEQDVFTTPDSALAGTPPSQVLETLNQPPQSKQPTFGGNGEWEYIHASAFLPFDNQVLPDYSQGTGYVTPHNDGSNYSPAYWVQLHLPNGAQIFDIYANVYDNTPNAYWRMIVTLYDHDDTPSFSNLSDTSEGGTPGYTTLHDNFSSYPIFHEFGDTEGDGNGGDLAFTVKLIPQGTYSGIFSLRFGGISVGWIRTISPAPATATFNDVPVGSAGFAHVEALAASGITAGCDATHYCPSAPVTRLQMAIYLAKALGLHWSL